MQYFKTQTILSGFSLCKRDTYRNSFFGTVKWWNVQETGPRAVGVFFILSVLMEPFSIPWICLQIFLRYEYQLMHRRVWTL